MQATPGSALGQGTILRVGACDSGSLPVLLTCRASRGPKEGIQGVKYAIGAKRENHTMELKDDMRLLGI